MMTVIWERIADNYSYIFDDLSHSLTKDWFLVSSPLPLFAILLTYNIFCAKIGPMLMKNRQPYKLATIIKLYNIFQVIISLYITYEGCVYMFSGNFNFKCQGVPESEERVARGIQTYLITKLIELLDTVFFVLRKSNRQITFLHLYHHTLMPTVSWIGIKYFPGGQGVIFGTINSFVHVVMYSYYFLSGLGPQYQKYLWWKKYLTVMQIVQFLIVCLHSIYSLFYTCSYHIILKLLTVLFGSVFIFMFSKFYYLTYLVNRNKQKQSSTQNKTQNSITNGSHRKGDESNGNSVSDRKSDEIISKNNINRNSNGSYHKNETQFNKIEKIKYL